MIEQSINSGFAGKDSVSQPGRFQRLGLFVIFFVCGVAIFVFGSNYFSLFPTNNNLAYNLALSAAFLIAALGFKRSARLQKYWQIAFAFFAGSLAFPLTSLLSGLSSTILGWLSLDPPVTSQGIAVAKVIEMVLVVALLILLTRLSGAGLGSIFLKRGNLKWGLSAGALLFFNFAASALMFFAARFTSMETLGAAIVWGIVFSFANGLMEELWLRGIFLKRLQPLIGAGGSILLTSIVFALMHTGAVYLTPAAIPFMLINTLTLGLACGYLMVKTDSIWGSMIVHAAADLFAFMAIFANA